MTGSLSGLENLPLDDEEEEEEEEEEQVEEEKPEVYYSEDFISGPSISDECTLPGNILEFDYSYGYDCKRYYNLTVADEKTLIFASGNFINFFNVDTKDHWFRRSAFGGGIGHITRNPNPEFPHIAVAENGTRPPIIVYDWPSLEIVCLLKNGTSKSYTHLNYSPNGMLLASQGGEPDFLITIFNWEKSRIVLRTKSNVNEVYRVMFSPDVPGQLTTTGLTHIKFWKMIRTFTGLKLQGELGRFGKTEYCDILGVYPMADEKVVSGTTWGNILIWDEGLIKMEVTGIKNRKCHDAPITQFYYSNGDLWSIGMDGRIRVWFYDTIDQADPPDDYRYVEVEPIYDFFIPEVIFMCIYKENNDPESTFYYAQDGNGGLWRIDLNTDEEKETKPPEQLYKCHAGAVVDIAACPWGPYLASLGVDGRLHIYQYEQRKLIFVHKFPAQGTAMIWLPLHVQCSGDEIIMGFDDGNLRVAVIDIDIEEKYPIKLTTIQVTKPHNRPVTRISLNKLGNILVSGGEDATIFIFQVLSNQKKYTVLVPIGYIRVPGIVTCLNWHQEHKAVVLVGCIHGHFVQVEVPHVPQPYTTITYILYLHPQLQRFTTYKAQIRRDIKIQEIEVRKAAKRAIKFEKLEQLKADNPGLDIDDEVFLADSDSEEELEPLHIPDIPNRVLWLQSTDEGTIWLSMGGYDAGYIYEYYMDQTSEIPSRYQIIYDGDDIEINNYVYSFNKNYLMLAMQDGSIKVVRVNPYDWRDLSDYWQLAMHDNYNGFIPCMCFNYDEKYFFTCGYDGNVFSYRFYPDVELDARKTPSKLPIRAKPIEVPDVNGYTNFSLEEAIVRAEEDRILRVANEHKRVLLEKLHRYKESFQNLLERNKKLKPTQIIPREEFETDPRITEDLKNKLDADLALVKRKLAFQVQKSTVGLNKLLGHYVDPVDVFPTHIKGIQKNIFITIPRQRALSIQFHQTMATIDRKMEEDALKRREPERVRAVAKSYVLPPKKAPRLEYFLAGLSTITIEKHLGAVLSQLLMKYRKYKQRREERKEEWAIFKAHRPIEGVNHPDDETGLAHAMANIGNYPLKSALDYKVPKHLQATTIKKYKELCSIRLKQFNVRHNCSMKVVNLRTEKTQLREYVAYLENELKKIQEEIDVEYHKHGPKIPPPTNDLFLENNLKVVVQLPPTKKELEAKPIVKCIVLPPKGDLLEKEVLTMVSRSSAITEKIVEPDTVDWFHEEATPWEIEVRNYRTERKFFEQEITLQKMQKSITKFDNKLEELRQENFHTLLKADFIDIHVLTLNEELHILNEIETIEDELQENLNNRIQESLDMNDLIQDIHAEIKNLKMTIKQLQTEENDIREQFLAAAIDNKFYDFLRRIFKKRYKPPKIRDPDDTSSSESSSSSSSEEEADTGSIDSRDFGIIRYDENVCPKGCDLALYNLTFELRSIRHQVEIKIKNCKDTISNLLINVDKNNKKLLIIESNLKQSRERLEAFQREKQYKLNHVPSTVVLKLNQLQHLISRNRASKIPDVLIFPKTVLSKLYKRVGELHNETLSEKITHRENITHACRMKTDMQHMRRRIIELRRELSELMIIKFSQDLELEKLDEEETKGKLFIGKIGLDELKEVDLKKMIFTLRMAKTRIHFLYAEELKLWEERLRDKQEELMKVVRENTARVDLLATLNTEKSELGKLVALQKKKKEGPQRTSSLTDAFKGNIKKLSKIIQKQNVEIQLIKADMKRLSFKELSPYCKPLTKKLQKLSEVKLAKVSDYEESPHPVDEEEQIFTTQEICRIPSYETEDAEVIVKNLILEMLASIQSYQDMPEVIVESIVQQIIKDVLKRSSIYEIIDNLIALLPEEPTNRQQSIIEFTAEQIFALKKTEGDINNQTARAILDDIIEKVLEISGPPHDVLATLVEELVKNLPSDFLLKKDSINKIINKAKDHLLDSEIDMEQLIHGVLESTSSQANDMRMLLDEILKVVFGKGIDYLYYIKY